VDIAITFSDCTQDGKLLVHLLNFPIDIVVIV